MKKILKNKFLWISLSLILIGLLCPFIFFIHEKYKPYYTNEDFNIKDIYSEIDANNNGIDDYKDILLGAKIDAKNHPTYDGRYWSLGYPPDDIGVCTDVIWRSFKHAGYNLRRMVDNDIKKRNDDAYHIKYPDSNIDFRRVSNLETFFKEYALNLTNNINKFREWQAGDIVVFNHKHIGIISNKRNKLGLPYVIHNSGQPLREEDILAKRSKKDPITGHFRWNVKDKDILEYWN